MRLSPEALAWCRRAPIVKSVDNGDALRVAAPGSVRIFRHFFGEQDLGRTGASVMGEVLSALGTAPATHVEGFNEGPSKLGAGLERHLELTKECVDFLAWARPDLTYIGFSFATENVEQADWAYLRAHKFGGCKVVGWHHYWGNQGFTRWEALRYRTYWRSGDPRIAITEAGRDAVEGGKGGWLADGIAPDRYLAELEGYEAETNRDPYVLGVTPFTAGATRDWSDYGTDVISGRIGTQRVPGVFGQALVPVATGGKVADFVVGQGVTELMAKNKDLPLSDEHYVVDSGGRVFKSETFGSKGLYVWSKEANRTVVFPFG